jgi:hypothetical protein
MTNSRLTCVYCVVRARRPPSLIGAPRGLAGATRLRALQVGDDAWIVASDVPASRYGEAALERGLRDLGWVSRCALAHAAVVKHFANAPAVVPLKLFTLFTSDASAVAQIGRARRSLERALDRVAGCAEWAVRVAYDPARDGGARPPRRRDLTGAEFLRRKRDAVASSRASIARARTRAAAALRGLDAIARESRARRTLEPAGGASAVILDVAYLVPASRRARFADAVARAAHRVEDAGQAVTLTGPFPPYNFVGERS